MKLLIDCHLYTFIDTAYLHGRDAALVAQQLCDGGSDLIQLRAKNSSPEEILRLAEKIQPVLQRANVGLVINDHLDIAQRVGADFCHLGQEDFFDDAGFMHVSQLFRSRRGNEADDSDIDENSASSRRRLQDSRGNESHSSNPQSAIDNPESNQSLLTSAPTLKIGLSTHAPAQAERAIVAEPAYIAIGPVFATPTKPTAKAVTLDYVRWAAAHVKVPWFAIGGINLKNLDEVLSAGARRICAVSAILNAPDVAAACLEFKKRLNSK